MLQIFKVQLQKIIVTSNLSPKRECNIISIATEIWNQWPSEQSTYHFNTTGCNIEYFYDIIGQHVNFAQPTYLLLM